MERREDEEVEEEGTEKGRRIEELERIWAEEKICGSGEDKKDEEGRKT